MDIDDEVDNNSDVNTGGGDRAGVDTRNRADALAGGSDRTGGGDRTEPGPTPNAAVPHPNTSLNAIQNEPNHIGTDYSVRIDEDIPQPHNNDENISDASINSFDLIFDVVLEEQDDMAQNVEVPRENTNRNAIQDEPNSEDNDDDDNGTEYSVRSAEDAQRARDYDENFSEASIDSFDLIPFSSSVVQEQQDDMEQNVAIPTEEDGSSEIRHFDTNLPAEHLYLGDNMNRVSGVEYLEAGRVHRLMLFLHQHIVYPGEVIPFMIPGFIIDADIDSNNGLLFGVAFAHVRCPKTNGMYGVTCHIYEKGTDERGNTLIKSRALQRFITTNDTRREHLEYITSGPQLKTFGHVKILPENHLPEPLSTINLGSMHRFRDIPRLDHYLRDFQATTTIWPKYIYNQYSINTVIEKVFKSLEAHKVDSMPNDPIRLSFWLSRNSHFSEEQLKSIFITDSVNLRMRIIGDSFNDGGVFVCRFCRNEIAYCRDLFAMSKHGVQSQYCNSAGYIHETNTVYRVFNNSVIFSGEPSSEFSWFPGYKWHIIICKMCSHHIGWQFRANVPNLTPVLFYGITGSSVQIDKENQRRSRRAQRNPVLNTLIGLVGL